MLHRSHVLRHDICRRGTIALAAAAALMLGACGSDDSGSAVPETTARATAPETTAPDTTVPQPPVTPPPSIVAPTIAPPPSIVAPTIAPPPDGAVDTINVLDEGDLDAAGGGVLLPGDFQAGQLVTNDIRLLIDVELTLGDMLELVDVRLEMDVTDEVRSVDGDEIVLASRIDRVAAQSETPGVAEETEVGLQPLVGDAALVRVDPRGRPLGPVELESGRAVPDEVSTAFDSGALAANFPDVPLGPGARWTAVELIESEGLVFEVTNTYELTELDDDEYVVSIMQESPVDQQLEGAQVTGSIVGVGEIRGSRSNPLQTAYRFEQSNALVFSDGVDEVVIRTRTRIESSSR